VPGWSVLISLVAFTLVYLTLAIVEFGLIVKFAQKGPEPLPDPDAEHDDSVENTPTTVY